MALQSQRRRGCWEDTSVLSQSEIYTITRYINLLTYLLTYFYLQICQGTFLPVRGHYVRCVCGGGAFVHCGLFTDATAVSELAHPDVVCAARDVEDLQWLVTDDRYVIAVSRYRGSLWRHDRPTAERCHIRATQTTLHIRCLSSVDTVGKHRTSLGMIYIAVHCNSTESLQNRSTITPWPRCSLDPMPLPQYGAFSTKAITRYQVILLGEQRHIRREQLAPGCCPNNAAVGVEPATSRSRIQRPTATPPRPLVRPCSAYWGGNLQRCRRPSVRVSVFR